MVASVVVVAAVCRSIGVTSSLLNEATVFTCLHQLVVYLSAVEEWRLEEEEAFGNEEAVVVVKRLVEVVEVVEVDNDPIAPVVHEVVTSMGDASVVYPFTVQLAVFVTLGGWVDAPSRGLNKSVAN